MMIVTVEETTGFLRERPVKAEKGKTKKKWNRVLFVSWRGKRVKVRRMGKGTDFVFRTYTSSSCSFGK